MSKVLKLETLLENQLRLDGIAPPSARGTAAVLDTALEAAPPRSEPASAELTTLEPAVPSRADVAPRV